MDRVFSKKQKDALYVLANRKCQICGNELREGWHADHVVPWSKGGKTDVSNGQALCAKCNQEKGSHVKKWREWQEECFNDWISKNKQDYLIAATPGCGKTKMALRLIKAIFDRGDASRVVIVVPTEYLKYQWMGSAHDFGISIDPNGTRAQETSDYDGRATTYSAVLSGADIYRYGTGVPTIAVFDEIHHAGLGAWGQSLQHAFDNAKYRILLSGTPFRTDQAPIPYVSYSNGVSVPDFEYNYSDALREEILKTVNFIHIDCHTEWELRGADFEQKISDIGIDPTQRNYALRNAYRVDDEKDILSEWLNEALTIANNKLEELRRDMRPDTAGIIFVENQSVAREFETNKRVRDIFGEYPVAVYSDKKESKSIIRKFSKSDRKWIVSVKQISEGVDIPRLAVAVYATVEKTEMIFRQRIARVLRIEDTYPENVAAFVCIPDDPDIVALAKTIEDECIAVMDEDFLPPGGGGGGTEGPRDVGYVPGDTDNVQTKGVISSGDVYEAPYPEAEIVARRTSVPVEQVIKVMSELGNVGEPNAQQIKENEPHSHEPMADMVVSAHKHEDIRTGKLAYKLCDEPKNGARIGIVKKEINAALLRFTRKPKPDCTLDELKKREVELERWWRDGCIS